MLGRSQHLSKCPLSCGACSPTSPQPGGASETSTSTSMLDPRVPRGAWSSDTLYIMATWPLSPVHTAGRGGQPVAPGSSAGSKQGTTRAAPSAPGEAWTRCRESTGICRVKPMGQVREDWAPKPKLGRRGEEVEVPGTPQPPNGSALAVEAEELQAVAAPCVPEVGDGRGWEGSAREPRGHEGVPGWAGAYQGGGDPGVEAQQAHVPLHAAVHDQPVLASGLPHQLPVDCESRGARGARGPADSQHGCGASGPLRCPVPAGPPRAALPALEGSSLCSGPRAPECAGTGGAACARAWGAAAEPHAARCPASWDGSNRPASPAPDPGPPPRRPRPSKSNRERANEETSESSGPLSFGERKPPSD